MLKITALFVLIFSLMAAGASVQGAAGYGHFIIASRTIDAINGGKCKAPAALKEALKDPECVKAFCGGAVGPDIIPEKTHYYNTGDLANRMVADANKELKQAKLIKNSAAIKEARIKLAFAYGWLSHCAADLNIHPAVNMLAGDDYKNGGIQVKARHATVEVMLDAYIYNNFKKPNDKFNIKVPYDFLSKYVGASEDELRSSTKKLVATVMGELASKDWVEPTNKDFLYICKQITKNSIETSIVFVEDPSKMQNWDLDVGPISTEDYKKLRSLVIEANGGKLPDSWGMDYLDIYAGKPEYIKKYKLEKYLKRPAPDIPDFNLPKPPKVHKELTDVDRLQVEQWRDKCIRMLQQQMENDPLRIKNKEECMNLPRENRELTCANCGYTGVHWWIAPSWSCPQCEYCTMPQDVRRADGMTYREYAEYRKKIYEDKMEEIRKQADQILKRK